MSFYNMNNSCVFWEKEKLFQSILAQDAVKNRSRDSWQTDTKSIKSWISPALPIEPNFLERSFKKTQVHREPGKPHLIFTSVPAWVAGKPVDKVDHRRKELSPKDCQGQPGAQGAQGAGRHPGLSEFPRIFWWSQRWMVPLCFASEQCLLRNLFCWKIAKQLYSEALGWLFCQTQNISKGLLGKMVAMALNPPLPKQLLQTKQDIMGYLK